MELDLHQIDLRYARLRRRDARRERAIVSSLSELGQQVPVVVVADHDRYVLVDGYKRVRALQRLHRDTVTAMVWPISEAEALLLARLMRTTEADSPLEQAWLLCELHQRFGLSAGELARRFDKSPSWVSRRLALVGELPEPVQDLVRRGELSAHVAMKHLVPLARAKNAECVELASALAGHGLSSRQAAALCAAWASASTESRKLILTDPLLVLRAEQETRRPRELTPSQRLLADVAAVAAISRRAQRGVREGAARLLGGTELRGAFAAAEADTAALFIVLRKELGSA